MKDNMFNIKIWKVGNGTYDGHMVESKRGVYGALRHCMGLAGESGFSDCDMSAKPQNYYALWGSGLKDCTGKEVFSDDYIINYEDTVPRRVEFKEGMFGVEIDGSFIPLSWYMVQGKTKIIGNHYQNPEIWLKEGENGQTS